MRPKLHILAIVLVLGTIARAQTVSIQLDAGTFRVTGWQAPATPPAGGWTSVFNVYAGTADAPAMLGSYAVEGGALVFRPRYPLAAGVKYRAVFRQPGQRPSTSLGAGPSTSLGAGPSTSLGAGPSTPLRAGTAIERIFDGPTRLPAAATRVERVYPSAGVLPSNTLRLYIYFSAPMSRGEVAVRLHILDGTGKELTDVLLPGQELWDPDNQRLTMTFDPGRIKRGLESNSKMGPPIAEGRRYTLVIDREWPDARGIPLAADFRKEFVGGPPVRVPPDQKQWRVTPPRAGTSAPLVVEFGRSMNYPLLQRMLEVAGPSGRVAGAIAVDRNETVWRFTPRVPWPAGAYRLLVDADLEDVSGNRIGQPFDIDVFEKVSEHLTTRTVTVPFSVR